MLRKIFKRRPMSKETKRKISKSRKGQRLSEETKKRIRKTMKQRGIRPPLPIREKNGMWKGGKYINQNGYVYILQPNHPSCEHNGYVFEHRYIMEQKLSRYLKPKERIHHINGIKTDNRIENLMLFSNDSEHKKFHLNSMTP